MNTGETEKCKKCGKTFRVVIIRYPTKMDDKRNSFYCCPYCNSTYDIQLLGNEDVKTEPVERQK